MPIKTDILVQKEKGICLKAKTSPSIACKELHSVHRFAYKGAVKVPKHTP